MDKGLLFPARWSIPIMSIVSELYVKIVLFRSCTSPSVSFRVDWMHPADETVVLNYIDLGSTTAES